MKMLPLPFPSTDIHALADWVEVSCILSLGRRASVGDLGRQLVKAAVLEDDYLDFESTEADVSTELLTRAKHAADSYPFTLDGSKLLLKSRFENFVPYTFCLCLSYFGAGHIGREFYPRRAFENISSLAAQNYMVGEGIRFGSPRDTMPSQFEDALNKLCILMGEGVGYRKRGIRKGQDDTLDLVAWKDSPDKRPGKLLLFGQCASGDNWEQKISELQPAEFCDVWLMDRPISIIKALFIPHRVQNSAWQAKSIRAGIIFDRCRIAYWAQQKGVIPRKTECVEWCRRTLRRGRN